ncbi:ribonuclease III [Geotalea toluenoxydans]
MSEETTKSIAGLEKLINYDFTDKSLLVEALTHPSFVNESGGKVRQDNQRLEFLGDAVVGLVLSHELFSRFQDSREGELTKLRASLVDEASLAILARAIDLGAHLKLGRGEERSGGRSKPSLLADAYEALLAAVYLDGGIEPAAAIIKSHFASFMEKGNIRTSGRDFKTEFQELAHRLRSLAPRYLLQGVSGPDHQRIFSVAVFIGEELMGEGLAKSKKEAEQAAAEQGIASLKKGSRP